MSDERYERGRALLDRINPENARRLEENLKDVAPDMARLVCRSSPTETSTAGQGWT